MGNCRAYFELTVSALGVVFSVTSFIVFIWVYENLQAGTWAVFGGVLSAVCLQLHILYQTSRLENYHTPQTLSGLEALGFVFAVVALAVTMWYAFATAYWHRPILPVGESLLVPAVWSMQTSKSGFLLFLYSRRYSRILRRNFTPLYQSI